MTLHRSLYAMAVRVRASWETCDYKVAKHFSIYLGLPRALMIAGTTQSVFISWLILTLYFNTKTLRFCATVPKNQQQQRTAEKSEPGLNYTKEKNLWEHLYPHSDLISLFLRVYVWHFLLVWTNTGYMCLHVGSTTNLVNSHVHRRNLHPPVWCRCHHLSDMLCEHCTSGSTKSDRQQEAAVEEVSNLTEIGCIAALLAGLEDGHLFTACWKPQTDIFARFSLSLGPSRPSRHYPQVSTLQQRQTNAIS